VVETAVESSVRRRAVVAGLLVLGLLPIAGRFASPTLGWGVHLTTYLPVYAWLASILGFLLLFVPPWRRAFDRLVYAGLGGALFGRSWAPAAVAAVVLASIFVLLRTPTHLLGDGVLIGELAARGAEFRAHDGMDYLLHRLALQAIGKAGDSGASFVLYAWGSWIAGAAGVFTALMLLRRSRLSVETRTLAFLLWTVSAASLLFCGYTESYGFLAVTMMGFLWSGAMAQRGEIRPWVPGLFFGLALFFHLMAVLALPALAWLIAKPGPRKAARGRWAAAVLLPAVLIPLAGLFAHILAGFDIDWFRHEFLESKNQRSMLIGLMGSHGLLSFRHWKDLLNWTLLVAPAAGWMIAVGARDLRRRAREPEFAFLSIQAACFAVVFILLDRKLGSARDWDIFAPHVAGFCWLAVRLWEPEVQVREEGGAIPPLRFAAVWVALLIAGPWFAVNASRDASVRRFAEMRTDFPTFPRAYATEELAKYHRDRGDLQASLPLYEESVRTYPRNARTRVLLGSNYLALNRYDDARAQFDEALRLDPDNWLALGLRAKLALRDEDRALARELYGKLARVRPTDPEVWAGLGYVTLREGDREGALEAFRRAAGLRPDPQYDYYIGVICASLGRWEEGIDALGRSVRGDTDGTSYHALAMALEGREAARGAAPATEGLIAAQEAAARAAARAPKSVAIQTYKQHIDRVVAGREAPVNLLR
jgi:tetratricopeptide (TPR) repeat protein